MIKKIFQNQNVIQFIKFGIVGVSGTILDFSVYNLCLIVFSWSAYIATASGFSFGLINNYIWNKLWTFKSKSVNLTHASKELVKFTVVALVGMGINLGVMAIIINYTNLGNSIFGLNIAKVLIVLCVGLWNFIGAKKWVFSEKVNSS